MVTELSCRIGSYIPRHEVFMLYVTVRFRPELTKACIISHPGPDSYHTFLIIILIFSSPLRWNSRPLRVPYKHSLP